MLWAEVANLGAKSINIAVPEDEVPETLFGVYELLDASGRPVPAAQWYRSAVQKSELFDGKIGGVKGRLLPLEPEARKVFFIGRPAPRWDRLAPGGYELRVGVASEHSSPFGVAEWFSWRNGVLVALDNRWKGKVPCGSFLLTVTTNKITVAAKPPAPASATTKPATTKPQATAKPTGAVPPATPQAAGK